MDIFNNREIASAIWIGIFIVIFLFVEEIRSSVGAVIKILFQKLFVFTFLTMVFYVAVIVFGLYRIGLWEYSQLKNTIQWFCFSGVVVAFRYATSTKEGMKLKMIIADNIKIIIILEFLVNAYTFSLIGELLFVPIVTMIVAVNAFSQSKEEYSSVVSLTNVLLSIMFFGLLAHSIANLVTDIDNFALFTTLQSFLLTPMLSILFMPFVYLFVLYIAYDTVFVRLNLGPKKSNKLKGRAKWEIFKICHLNLRKVRGTAGMNIYNLMQIQTGDDIEKMRQAYKTHL